MQIYEAQLEQAIYTQYLEDPQKLHELGLELPIDGFIYKQKVLGNYGRSDLLIVERDVNKGKLTFHIVELKRTKDRGQLNQACQYLAGIIHMISGLNNHEPFCTMMADKEIQVDFELWLIAESFHDKIEFLNWISPKIHVVTYNYDMFKGISFEETYYTGIEGHYLEDSELIATVLDFAEEIEYNRDGE